MAVVGYENFRERSEERGWTKRERGRGCKGKIGRRGEEEREEDADEWVEWAEEKNEKANFYSELVTAMFMSGFPRVIQFCIQIFWQTVLSIGRKVYPQSEYPSAKLNHTGKGWHALYIQYSRYLLLLNLLTYDRQFERLLVWRSLRFNGKPFHVWQQNFKSFYSPSLKQDVFTFCHSYHTVNHIRL